MFKFDINVVEVLVFLGGVIAAWIRLERRIYRLEIENKSLHRQTVQWTGSVLSALVEATRAENLQERGTKFHEAIVDALTKIQSKVGDADSHSRR